MVKDLARVETAREERRQLNVTRRKSLLRAGCKVSLDKLSPCEIFSTQLKGTTSQSRADLSSLPLHPDTVFDSLQARHVVHIAHLLQRSNGPQPEIKFNGNTFFFPCFF